MSTRRQRELREERRLKAKQSPIDEGPLQWGIKHISSLDPKEYPLVNLYNRVSTPPQKDHLILQRRGSKRILYSLGFTLAHRPFTEIADAKSLDPLSRPKLFAGLRASKNIPYIIPCISRLYRSPTTPWLPLSKGDFHKIEDILGGVQIYSLYNPNSLPREDEVWLRQLYSGKVRISRPKRPGYRKQQREEYLEEALRLRERMSLRQIAAYISEKSGYSITEGGIRKWFSKSTQFMFGVSS